jgi:hypothetical protein
MLVLAIYPRLKVFLDTHRHFGSLKLEQTNKARFGVRKKIGRVWVQGSDEEGGGKK